jgi:hypothetical protein
VDSSILVDLVPDDPASGEAAEAVLTDAAREGRVLKAPIVYAELSARFPDAQVRDRFLAALLMEVDGLAPDVLFAAGQTWWAYHCARPRSLVCATCGQAFKVSRTACGSEARPRQHVMADVRIGAHAELRADRL